MIRNILVRFQERISHQLKISSVLTGWFLKNPELLSVLIALEELETAIY
jgi:hypothetical protein